jgi:hypothetical protein
MSNIDIAEAQTDVLKLYDRFARILAESRQPKEGAVNDRWIHDQTVYYNGAREAIVSVLIGVLGCGVDEVKEKIDAINAKYGI